MKAIVTKKTNKSIIIILLLLRILIINQTIVFQLQNYVIYKIL